MSSFVGKKNLGSGQEIDEHLDHDHHDDQRQQNFQLIRLKPFTRLGPDLRADDRTEKQIQGQDEIHTMIHPCLHDGDVDTSKKYLEQAGAYDHMHRHAEDIDHYGDHNEAAADTHDGGEDAHQSS